MLFLHLLSCSLFSTAALCGVVTLYGTNGPSGDRVECSVPQLEGEEIAQRLSLENTDEIARHGTTQTKAFMSYDFNVQCGGDYADALATKCLDIGGDPHCLTGRKLTYSRRKVRSSSQKPYYCSDYTDNCSDTFEADQLGSCPSGYSQENVGGKGSGTGTWCSKACTSEQIKTCLEISCERRRTQCEQSPKDITTCRDALKRCGRSGPVQMDKSICNADLFQIYTPGGHKQPNLCKKCAEWKNDKCYLNVVAYDKAQKTYQSLFSWNH